MALSASVNFYFQLTKSGAGVTGKSASITATIKKVTRGSSPTITTVTTVGGVVVGSVSEVDATNAKGVYVVGVSGLDPTADYLAGAHYTGTSTDVDNVDVPSFQSEFSMSINAGAIPQITAGTSNGGLPVLDTNGDLSAKLGAAAQAMVLQMTRGRKGTVWIVDPVNGNDTTGAGTWASPIATPLPTGSGQRLAASAGDVVLVCGSTCSMGSSRYIMVAGVTIAGLGKEATTLTSSFNLGEIVKVASNCTVRDLTVKSTLTPAGGAFNYPVGANGTTVTNVMIQRVATYADTDAFYFTGAGSTATIEDCTPHSNWDCIFAQGAGTYIQMIRTPIFTTASNAASATSNSSVQAEDGAFIRLIDCPIVNFNTNTQASRQTNVVHAINSSASGARIELVRSPIFMSVDGSVLHSITADTGTTVVVENSPYDTTKASIAGTLIDLNLPAVTANWLTATGINAGALNGKGDWLLASSYVAPDNADIVTSLNDLVTLLARTDPTTNLTAVKAVTDKLNTMLATSGLNYTFTVDALKNAPAGGGGTGGSAGTGDIVVNQNTGGVDNLRFVDGNGNGIDGASITAYLQTDWTANELTATARGQAFTGTDGRWATPMMLNAGTYVFVFEATGYQVSTVTATVS